MVNGDARDRGKDDGDVVAASLPVAYLTAQTALTMAGFKPGKTVVAPAIGGSVGNATYQLARAQGAGKVISTAGSAAKAAKARELGFEDLTRHGGTSPRCSSADPSSRSSNGYIPSPRRAKPCAI
jgi:NADPH:quinone reductase-like Zn-dependent oxidoreductase